jgi:hypothetical protein
MRKLGPPEQWPPRPPPAVSPQSSRSMWSAIEEEYRRLFDKEWSTEKGKVAFALSEASRVLHSLHTATYPMADSWVKAVKNKADISPGKLAERANDLTKRRRPG